MKAALSENAKAQGALGLRLALGNGMPKDYDLAVHWLTKAADHGDAEAQYNLGVIYGNGNGVPENQTEAAHLFLRAAEPASFAGDHAASAACFTPIERNTASCGPRQRFAALAKNAALEPVPRLPENLQYRGEALFEIAHARGSLLSLGSELQARQSSSGEP